MRCRAIAFQPLVLTGDADHIVRPADAKGLNLAASNVRYLSDAFTGFLNEKSKTGIDHYSKKTLASIWKAERFSWAKTMMTHHFPNYNDFDRHMQRTKFDYLVSSQAAQKVFAENFTEFAF